MATKLVYISKEGSEPLTDTSIIANALNYHHENVIKLARRYKCDLEAFGPVGFEIQSGKDCHGWGSDRQVALLNEQQATLLICYMRNSEKVRAFKLKLVKAFYEMKKHLEEQKDRKASNLLNLTYRQGYEAGQADYQVDHFSKHQYEGFRESAYREGWEAARDYYAENIAPQLADCVPVPKTLIQDLQARYDYCEKLRPQIIELVDLLRRLLGQGSSGNSYTVALCELLNNFIVERRTFLKTVNTPILANVLPEQPVKMLRG